MHASQYYKSNFPPLLPCGEGESRFPKLKDKAPLVASFQEDRNKGVPKDVFSTSSNMKTYRDACVSSGKSFRRQTELSGMTDIKRESNKRCVSIRKLNHIEHRPKPHRCANKIREIKSTELSSSKNQRRTLASYSRNTVPSITKAKSSLKGANSIYTTTNENKFGIHKVLPSIPKHQKEDTSASDNLADEKKSMNKDIKPKPLDKKKNGHNAASKVKKQPKIEKSNVPEPLQTQKSERCRNSVEKIKSINADCNPRDAPYSVRKSSSGKTGAKNRSGPKATDNEIVRDGRRSKGLIDRNSDSVWKVSATNREDENENHTCSITTLSDKTSISRKSSATIKRSGEQSNSDMVGGDITSQKRCVGRKSSSVAASHATRASVPSKSRTKNRSDRNNGGIKNVKECIGSKSNSVSSVLSVASRVYDRSDSVSPHSARKVMASKSRTSIRSCHKGSDRDIVDGDRCSVKRCTDSKPSSVMSVLSATSRRYDRSGSITPCSARDSMPSKSSARIRNTCSCNESDSASVDGDKISPIECVESTSGSVTYMLSTPGISPQPARKSVTSKSSAIVGNSCEETNSDGVDLYISNVKECVDSISVTSVLSAQTGTHCYSGSVSSHSARELISRKSSERIRNHLEVNGIVDGDNIGLKKCVDIRSGSVTYMLSTTSNRYDCRDTVSLDSARESSPSTSKNRKSCEELDSGIVGVDKKSVKECISNSSPVLSAAQIRHDIGGCVSSESTRESTLSKYCSRIKSHTDSSSDIVDEGNLVIEGIDIKRCSDTSLLSPATSGSYEINGSVTPHSVRESIQINSRARIIRSYKDPDSDTCVEKISVNECVGSERRSVTGVLSRIPRYDRRGSDTHCSARGSKPSKSSARIGRSGRKSNNDQIKRDKHRVQGCIDNNSSSATSVSSKIPRYDRSGSVTQHFARELTARKSSARIGRSGGESKNELFKGDKHEVKLCIDKKSSSATIIASRIPRYDRSGSVTPSSTGDSNPRKSTARIGRSSGASNIELTNGDKHAVKLCIDKKSRSATIIASRIPRYDRSGSVTPRSARESIPMTSTARNGRSGGESHIDHIDGKKYRVKECIDNQSSSATSVLSEIPRRCHHNGSITHRSASEFVSSKIARVGRNKEYSECDIVDGHIMSERSSFTSILSERKRKNDCDRNSTPDSVRKSCSRTSNVSIRNSCTTSESI